ncbi:MAG: hypothetical protein Kow00121_21410 [Elainellaceae cyanobacterium]
MAYSDRPRSNVVDPVAVTPTVVDYHDRVRWGPIIAGIMIAIGTQLVLSALGAAIGLSIGASGGAQPGDIGIGVGIWQVISLLIALFIGSWVMASTCGPMNNKTAMLNGAILWATTLALSAWLLATGVSGTFGIVASNAGEVLNQATEPGGVVDPGAITPPNVTAEEAQRIASRAAQAGWYFLLGALLGLAASLIGAVTGARKPRTIAATTTTVHR